MSFPPCSSPPPPLPSPVLVPTPLPAPPRLVKKPFTLSHALSHDALPRVGADNTRPRTIKRTFSQLSTRCRSPPPSPATHSPPPPVPPIPPFVLAASHSFIRPKRAPAFDLYLDHPSEDHAAMRQAGGPLTCVQFFAVHSPKGQCRA
jgi:hypothetical protein